MADKLQLASEFVNSTAGHIFLTGKAGTGKTTFLRKLDEITHKNFLVVAPTGVAALNAGGVTIHSQFLFPFGTFVDGQRQKHWPPQGNFYTPQELARRNPLDSRRRRVLQSIELLVIDEVSMCRADIIDAIDYRLRSIRRTRKPFGGVQLLMIGDLFQLPPIVKDFEWQVLSERYASIHFFEAQALRKAGFNYLELDKIFRQSDGEFIALLNNLRANRCTEQDLKLLNSRYRENAEAEEGVITLVTHNRQADSINRKRLDALPGASRYYEASLEGDFPESMFPLPESLELREGAQVMFIKNDTEGDAFYNGKIAKVVKLEEQQVLVAMDGDEEFSVPRLTWQNRRYEVSESDGEVKEKVLGSFEQFPLRLAWAVTVHKSQGLTFDKAVIDVGQAFAPGQVYVALSRLTSLEGLLLRTRVSPEVISSDGQVTRFVTQRHEDPPLAKRLADERRAYLQTQLQNSFDFTALQEGIQYFMKKYQEKLQFEDPYLNAALPQYRDKLWSEQSNSLKFQRQLMALLQENNQHEKLIDRLEKGTAYYQKRLGEWLNDLLLYDLALSQVARTKSLRNAVSEQQTLLVKQFENIQRSSSLCGALLRGEPVSLPKNLREERRQWLANLRRNAEAEAEKLDLKITTKTGKKKKAKKPGQTYLETYALLEEGLNADQIAEKRGLASSTIYGHFARGIRQEKITINQVFEKEQLAKLMQTYAQNPDANLMALAAKDERFSINQWRVAMAHFELGKKDTPAPEN